MAGERTKREFLKWLALPLVISPLSANAEGFDLYGFKQGMTKAEVEQLSSSRSYKLETYPVWWQIWTNDKEYILLDFCDDDRLSWVSYDILGGFINYARMLEQYTKKGYTISNTSIGTYVTSNGIQYGDLQIDLFLAGEEFNVSIIAKGNDKGPNVDIQLMQTALPRCPEWNK